MGICKAKYSRCVQLLIKATFTFLTSSVKIYKHHSFVSQMSQNNNAFIFSNLASSPPGVLVIEEESDVTFYFVLVLVSAQEEEAFITN